MSDILDLIDEATEDWQTSVDAMRWAPPWHEPVVRDPKNHVEQLMAQGWDGYAATAHVRGLLAVSFAAFTQSFLKAIDTVNEALAGFRFAFASPEVVDRTTALAHRRNRHTGPPAPRMDGRRR